MRKSDWEGAETAGRQLLQYLDQAVQEPFERRRKDASDRISLLGRLGNPLPPGVSEIVSELPSLLGSGKWGDAIERLLAVEEGVRGSEAEYGQKVAGQLRQFLAWSGQPPESAKKYEPLLRPLPEAIRSGQVAGAIEAINAKLRTDVPAAAELRDAARDAGESLAGIARDLGASWTSLEQALAEDKESPPLRWPETVGGIEKASRTVAEELRDRVRSAVEGMRATLESLREQGVDPTANLNRLEEIVAQLPNAAPSEMVALLQGARQATEEPVVAVVASYLDDVRPRLVEARRLGRDLTEVFVAMNRAREALRLKIYSEALAASQEAVERVAQLTGDFEGARGELESLRAFLSQFASTKFPVARFEQQLDRAKQMLQSAELGPARALLRETAEAVGREALDFFQGQLTRLKADADLARSLGFLPPDADAAIAEAKARLESAQFDLAAERIAEVDAHLRAAAGPFVARRIEEIEAGLSDIGDEALMAPVRRLLADSDVSLRVKEDFRGAFESLRRAEREFSSVVAARASSLVEALDEERKVLELMDGTGDEIQRQIDEVQQIFNMGDFVKASKASQEIRVRAQQQQLVASEEAISHAKLALVELGTLGLDTASLKGSFERAQETLKAGQYLNAFRAAKETRGAAEKMRGQAQQILNLLAEATQEWQSLKKAGVEIEPYREQIAEAKGAYQALDFDKARATLAALGSTLTSERKRADTQRRLAEATLLLEDARRLSLPVDALVDQLNGAKAAAEKGDVEAAYPKARDVHDELITLLRPVLEETFRSLESDLEAAAGAGLEVEAVRAALTEGRRRLGQAVPAGVTEILEGARSQLYETKGFLEHAERAKKRTLEALSNAELVRVPTDAYRAKIERVDQYLAQHNYAKAVESASNIERELTQATHQHVSRTLASFQGMLARAKQGGADTTLAENLLHQGRSALEEGHPLDALQLAVRSESEIERVELQLRLAEGSLRAATEHLGKAVKLGVVAPHAEAALGKAKDAFQRHEYATVLDLTFRTTEEVTDAEGAFGRARDAVQIAERAIEEARQRKADLTESLASVESARKLVGEGRYSEGVRAARDAAERARWSVERLYAGELSSVRALVDAARAMLPPEEAQGIARALEEAEAALKSRDLKGATSQLDKTRRTVSEELLRRIAERRRSLEQTFRDVPAATAAEAEERARALVDIGQAVEQGALPRAIELLGSTEGTVRAQRREAVKRRAAEMQERLLLGEKLGADTTPVMELVSAAKNDVEAGRADEADGRLGKGAERLAKLMEERIETRARDLATEVLFADEGLHVTLGPIPASLKSLETLRGEGRTFEAGKLLIGTEEELGRRKSLHRELLNLHYLVDSALARATEKHLDVTKARALLDESIRARAADYAVAIEKARAALNLLQTLLKEREAPVTVPAAGFWPFRRASGPTKPGK